MQGLHLTADLRGCAAGRPEMTETASLQRLCLAAVARAGLTPVGELLVSAPLPFTPLPLIVSGSATEIVNPFKSKAPPEPTAVPPAVVPKGELLPLLPAPNLSVPALIVVAPV